MRTPTLPVRTHQALRLGGWVVVADQLTKTVARAWLPPCTGTRCETTSLLGVIELAQVRNAGSAFGFAQGMWIWTLIAVVGLLAAGVVAARARDRLVAVGAALLSGGAVANLADRVVAGGVTDFIGAGPIVFNLADVALLAGCVAMTVGLQRMMGSAGRVTDTG